MDKLQIKKQSTPYKVVSTANSTKDVDLGNRMVKGVFNSYYYIDSDLDMLIDGCAKKSISERGVNSKKGNKIKHLKDHDWSQVVADIKELSEGDFEYNGKNAKGIIHNSYYPESTDSNDLLIKIESGLYDARSIGFQYVDITLAEKDSEIVEYKRNWEIYYPMALNPEAADEQGYFFVIKEIKLFEGSDVAFGANEFTPCLGVKSSSKQSDFDILNQKLSIMTSLFSKGNMSDEAYHRLQMEELQIKQYICSIKDKEPAFKDTFLQSRKQKTTQNSALDFYKGLLK